MYINDNTNQMISVTLNHTSLQNRRQNSVKMHKARLRSGVFSNVGQCKLACEPHIVTLAYIPLWFRGKICQRVHCPRACVTKLLCKDSSDLASWNPITQKQRKHWVKSERIQRHQYVKTLLADRSLFMHKHAAIIVQILHEQIM